MSQFTLGILETGLVDVEFRKTYGDYPTMFIDLFKGVDKPPIYKSYCVIDGEYPAHIDECDAYLITGSKHDSFADEPWIIQLQDYVRELYAKRKKMLGICFGHQLLAHALGGKADRSDKGWGVGVYNSEIPADVNPSWLDGMRSFNLNVTHQDQVASIPDEATVLGHNPFCPYSAFFIADSVLCFQGHPEFSSEYTKTLMLSRQDRIPPPVLQKALDSLATPTDHLKIAQVMINFVRC